MNQVLVLHLTPKIIAEIPCPHGSLHAFLSHGDIDLLQSGLQQGVGSAVQIVLVGDPDAGEQFGLQLIRLQRMQAGQNRPQFFRLGSRTRAPAARSRGSFSSSASGVRKRQISISETARCISPVWSAR